ncbi:MAG TPA: NADH-quinone oxidoreductase subunit N [Bacteroidales bacterium]|nr:NADH-quinone oxidoreductase subunit N [Bacteroidales bacterium]
MDKIDFFCLAPLMILAAAPVIIMLVVTARRSFILTYALTLIALIADFLSLFLVSPYSPHVFVPLLSIDKFGLLFMGIIMLSAILITILSYEYLRIQFGEREEFFIILLVAVLGASILVLAEHFISFFLGLEILSISLYVLTAYLKWRDICIEAGVKFLVVSSISTAFLLFGMGLIYATTGTMSFSEIAKQGTLLSPVFLVGFGMMLVAIGFKLALFPFHLWAADVYQGAPMPSTAFIATISKGAVFALALRLFIRMNASGNETIVTVLSVISVATMFAGNFLALKQNNLKRLLAYSSIAHMGYLLMTLISGPEGTGAAVFYLSGYIVTTIAAFGVLTGLSVCERDACDTDDVVGLFRKNPWIAIVLTLAMLSLAGLPLTAGFMSKFYLVLSGAGAGHWILAGSLVLNSVISLYYYLRIVRIMFTEPLPGKNPPVPTGINFVIALSFAGILVLGILPSLLLSFINKMM